MNVRFTLDYLGMDPQKKKQRFLIIDGEDVGYAGERADRKAAQEKAAAERAAKKAGAAPAK